MEMLIFTGFPEEGLKLLTGLRRHNRREWFNERKDVYQQALLDPLRALVWELGLELSRSVAPRLVFEPAVNRTIFRINRDTRFSHDKSPYKTHVAAFLWEGSRGRLNSPGFYVQVDDQSVYIGVGIYRFDPAGLERYRRAVLDERMGERLEQVLADPKIKPFLPLGGEQLKRAPAGLPADHPRVELLRYKGLFAGTERSPRIALSRRLLNTSIDVTTRLGGLHAWLRDALG